MGNDEKGLIPTNVSYGIHHCVFGVPVQRTGGFIQDQGGRFTIESSRDTKPLSLTSAKPNPALSDLCIIAFGKGFYMLGEGGQFSRLSDTRHIDILRTDTKSNIRCHSVVTEKNILRHEAKRCLPGQKPLIRHFFSVDQEVATVRAKETQDYVDEGCLSGAGRAHESDMGPFRNLKRHSA